METLFRVTGPLWGDSTGHRRIPLTKAKALMVFFLSAPEYTIQQASLFIEKKNTYKLIRSAFYWDGSDSWNYFWCTFQKG